MPQRIIARGLAALFIAMLAMTLGAQRAAAYEHRRNTPSVGGQLHLGDLEYDSEWGDLYAWGRGGAIRVRQYIARNRAIGLSFELQKFNRERNHPADADGWMPDFFQAQILMVDYYFYFRRPRKHCQYLVASGGFYRPEIVDKVKVEGGGNTVTVEHPPENLLARLGIGTEYFITRGFAVDASVSGYYYNVPDLSGTTFSVEIALGIQVYAGK